MSDLTAQFELTLIDQISAPLRHVQESLRSLDRSLSAINSSGGAVHQTTKHIAETVDSVTTSSRNAYDSLFNLGSVSDEMKQAVYGGAGSLKDVQEKAASGGGALAEMNSHAGRSIGIMSQLHTQLGHVGKGLGHVVNASKGFHESVEKSMGRAFGAAAAGFGLIEPVRESAEFDNTIRHVGIGLEIHGTALDDYVANEKTKINELARSTGQRSGELADALGFFSREGFRGEELEKSLATVAKIATTYNANPEAVAKDGFALKESLHVHDTDLPGALASIAIAGKQADLPFERLAPLLPQMAASAGALGVRGRKGTDDLAASLAVVRKSVGQDSEATTYGRHFVEDITSPHVAKRWQAIFHEDLFGLEAQARKNGQDPMQVVMGRIKTLVDRVGDPNKALAMLFTNMQSKGWASALLGHWDQYEHIHELVSKADGGTIDRDYSDGKKSSLIILNQFQDSLTQLMRHIGDHFVPILAKITPVINAINSAFEWMDKTAPGVTTAVVGIVGGLLAFAATVSAISAIMGPITAGFGLIMSLGGPLMAVFSGLGAVIAAIGWPITLAIAGVVALGVVIYEMWKHWDKVSAFIKAAEDAITSFFGHIFKHLLPSSLYQTMAASQHHHPYAHAAAPVPPQHGPVALPHAATPAQPPVTIHVRHDKDLHVTADPHPHHMVHAMPHGGAMVGRP